MAVETRDVGWGFWLRWVLTSAIGWFVGMPLGWAVAEYVGYPLPNMPGEREAVALTGPGGYRTLAPMALG